MMKCGCIGKKLTHSFSKEIHAMLADYRYDLIELNEDQIPDFFARRDFNAVNVTIPYKQTVIPYLDWVSGVARKIGAVNTIVNKNGQLFGYNTDYYGMKALLERADIDVSGKKVLILGTGGTSKTAQVLTADLGAAEIQVVSRRKAAGVITYPEAAALHQDAQIIINTTPCGMYPDCEASPIALSAFKNIEGVIDAIYNPLNTNLILEAKKRGIKAEGGLYMLVMQAVVAVEKFLDKEIDKTAADRVFAHIHSAKDNIILVGGHQQEVAEILQKNGFELIYADAFETEPLRSIAAAAQKIIVVPDASVLCPQLSHCLKRNGKIYADGACADWADVIIPDFQTADEKAAYIMRKRMEMIL